MLSQSGPFIAFVDSQSKPTEHPAMIEGKLLVLT